MFFNEDHLKITKVRTLDGTTPLIVNERVQHKVIYAPNNALVKKLLEEQNTRLPNGMKMKIEFIKGYAPDPVPAMVVDNSETELLKKQLADLQKQNADLALQNKELEDFKVLQELEAEEQKNKAVAPVEQK
jgi:hypothetical protein